MNMILPTSVSATPNGTNSMPNGTTRPQVRIVIVGHVDHGKSTLVGRLLHETGSLPDGKLEMLKAVSARRGMPFEWSFLLDALQTERELGLDDWAQTCPEITGIGLTVGDVSWQAGLDAPAVAFRLPLDYFGRRETEQEEVRRAHRLPNLDVGAVERSNRQRAVHRELHVARARGFLAGR